MTKFFNKTILLVLLVLSILSAVSLAEEIYTPTEEVTTQKHSDNTAPEEVAQQIDFVPSVFVLYQDQNGGDSSVVLPDQPAFDAKNGGVFSIVASCITPENATSLFTYRNNTQGMGLLGFYLGKVENGGVVTVLEIVDFPDPTYGTVPLYDLEPGEYILYVEGVGVANHQEVKETTINSVSGWQKYHFKIVE